MAIYSFTRQNLQTGDSVQDNGSTGLRSANRAIHDSVESLGNYFLVSDGVFEYAGKPSLTIHLGDARPSQPLIFSTSTCVKKNMHFEVAILAS